MNDDAFNYLIVMIEMQQFVAPKKLFVSAKVVDLNVEKKFESETAGAKIISLELIRRADNLTKDFLSFFLINDEASRT